MAISNKTKALLIATEISRNIRLVTLHCMVICVGFALLKIFKTRVYDLCNWINNYNENSKGKIYLII